MDKQLEVLLKGAKFAKLIDQQMQEIKEMHQLKKVEIDVLYYLAQCGSFNTSKDIRNNLTITKGHVSQAVDQLCKKELIKAIPDKEDHRYVHYITTEKAIPIVEDITSRKKKVSESVLKNLTEKELQYFRVIAQKIYQNIDEMYEVCELLST